MKLDELKQIVNIKDIASSLGFKISKNGTRYWLPCPFHNDKNPSFLLNQSYGYCFTCKTQADAFKLVMQVKQCDFNNACEYIASYYNETYETKNNDKYKNLQDRLDKALISYQNALNDECKAYLNRRGIDEKSIASFKIGYGVKYEKCEDELKLHFFNNRLVIPIFNNNKLVGFGARSLEKNPKIKYINSPESILFKKSNLLFGLNTYHIKTKNAVIIVEGYFDVILAHQYGYKNVVATLGTALNDFHIKRLSNITSNIIFLFDNDNAGLNASIKAAKTYINNEYCKIGLIDFKCCKDLGELLLKDSECLNKIKTQELALFLCEQEMKEYKKGENNIQIINNISNILNSIKSTYLQSFYRTKICEIYNLDIKYFSLSIKKETEQKIFNLEKKSEIEASILYKCINSKKDFKYVNTYLNETHFLDFFDIAKKVFNNIDLNDSELAQIDIYANKESSLNLLVGYKLKDYSLWLIKETKNNNSLNAIQKAQKISELQKLLLSINAQVGLNAR